MAQDLRVIRERHGIRGSSEPMQQDSTKTVLRLIDAAGSKPAQHRSATRSIVQELQRRTE